MSTGVKRWKMFLPTGGAVVCTSHEHMEDKKQSRNTQRLQVCTGGEEGVRDEDFVDFSSSFWRLHWFLLAYSERVKW